MLINIIQILIGVIGIILLAGIFWLCTRFMNYYEIMMRDMDIPADSLDDEEETEEDAR